MWTKILGTIFDKENLKLNGQTITVILLILALMGGGYTYYKLVSNHLEHNNTALLQQAVTNEKVAGSLDKLTAVLERKLK